MEKLEKGEVIKNSIIQIVNSARLKLKRAEKLFDEQEETIVDLAEKIGKACSDNWGKEPGLSQMKIEVLSRAIKKQEKAFKGRLSMLKIQYEQYFQYAETTAPESFPLKQISKDNALRNNAKTIEEHLDEFAAFIISFEIFCRKLSLIISEARDYVQIENKEGRHEKSEVLPN